MPTPEEIEAALTVQDLRNIAELWVKNENDLIQAFENKQYQPLPSFYELSPRGDGLENIRKLACSPSYDDKKFQLFKMALLLKRTSASCDMFLFDTNNLKYFTPFCTKQGAN